MDTFYFYYFLIHIPITLLIDSSLVVPPESRPAIQEAFIAFHLSQNNDFLLKQPIDLWLVVFGWFEILFQLPLFVILVFDYLRNKKAGFSVTIWPLVLIYGFNASFTTLVCLVYVMLEYAQHGLVYNEMLALLGVYLPTFLIPLVMMVDYGCRIAKRLGTNLKHE